MSVTAEVATLDDARESLPRSASYNHIPQLAQSEHEPGLQRTLSEVNLKQSSETQLKLDHDTFTTGKEILRQSSLRSKDKSKKDNKPTFTFSEEGNDSADANPQTTGASPQRPQKNRSVSRSLVSLARRPFASSRSPSPSSKPREVKSQNAPAQNDGARGTARKSLEQSKPKRASLVGPSGESTSSPATDESSRRREVLVKANRRSLNNYTPKPKDEPRSSLSRRPSLPSLRSKSRERVAASLGIPATEVPPVPQATPAQAQQYKLEPSRKKDELWSVFRSLDADFQKFHSKPSALKANIVRTSVIPNISRYADHPSSQSLRPEDLDRRINIMNKWWTGLLETLNGKVSQSMAGSDRPVYLEAIVAIMTRPEWRIPPISSSSTSMAPGPSNSLSSASQSNTSVESTGSDFLVESIHHNIRNIFAQNLLSQMAYIIDRMSLRHAPASLVAFSGKTCAYAFFFCPGVADMLVQLWNTSPNSLRRIISYFDMETNPKKKRTKSEDTLSNFPQPVRSLRFTTHASIMRFLRERASPPLGASNVNWFGPWISRWCGRDTDLFFVFVKYFHILVTELLSPQFEKSNRLYVPGLVLVHSQLLAVIEDTLNKQSGPPQMDSGPGASTTTFDDFIDGADATAMPLGAANSLRAMSENRLVTLLKDVLTDRSMGVPTKDMLVESVCGIVKVAARKTSLFDHNSCFVLCDFVEELLAIVPPYCQLTEQPDLLDWDFWLDVCLQMMESNNALTEVRAFAFIYAAWDVINAVESRKERLCLDILLHDTRFHHYFSHWSPMVRAYFHRLICWRLARYTGEPSPINKRVYKKFSDHLGKIWISFLAYQTKAQREQFAPLSTAPCSPAPGRRLIIIRNDYRPPPSMFICLDNVVPPSLSDRASQNSGQGNSGGGPPDSQVGSGKKGWSRLKSMFGGPTNNKPGEVTPPGSASENQDGIRGDEPSNANNSKPGSGGESLPPGKPRVQYTFRFSLEWIDRSRYPSKNKRLFPPRLPIPAQLFLQSLREREIEQSDSASGSISNSMSGGGSDDESEIDDGQINATTPTPTGHRGAVDSANTLKPAATSVLTRAPEATDNFVISKYAGRALAEWSQVVVECDNFFERRRDEGVPNDKMVETPTMGVESFRK